MSHLSTHATAAFDSMVTPDRSRPINRGINSIKLLFSHLAEHCIFDHRLHTCAFLQLDFSIFPSSCHRHGNINIDIGIGFRNCLDCSLIYRTKTKWLDNVTKLIQYTTPNNTYIRDERLCRGLCSTLRIIRITQAGSLRVRRPAQANSLSTWVFEGHRIFRTDYVRSEKKYIRVKRYTMNCI